MKHYILLLFLLFTATLSLQAEHFYSLTMQNGLSQTSVMAIQQDGIGRMWFGTEEGLNMYDGENITYFKGYVDNGVGKKLWIGNLISALATDSKGNVWFISNNNLYKYDIRSCFFTQITTGEKTFGLTFSENAVWFVNNGRLYKMTDEKLSPGTFGKMPRELLNSLLLNDGKIYVGARSGLYIYSTTSSAVQHLLPGIEIYRLFVSSDNELWIGTRMQGLYRLKNGKLTQVPCTPGKTSGTCDLQIREFTEDAAGNIWFGTFSGLQKYDRTTRTYSVVKIPAYAGGLTHPSVFSLYKDRQGTIWIGSYYGGVNFFNSEGSEYVHYDYQAGMNNNLYFSYIGDMIQDKDDHLWISTDGGGISCVDKDWNLLHSFSAGKPNSIAGNNIKSICYDHDNNSLYIGTYLNGLSRYDISNGRFYNYLFYNRGKADTPQKNIYHLKSYNGAIYMSSMEGFFKLNPQTNRFTKITIPNYDGYIVHFDIDPSGNLYTLSHDNLKIYPLNNPQRETSVPLGKIYNGNILSILSLNEGTFLCTLGGGLLYYDRQSGKVTSYTTENSNIPTNYCYKIARSPKGPFILTTDQGIVSFNPQTHNFLVLEQNEKSHNASITARCGLLIGKDGKIYAGDTKGIICLNDKVSQDNKNNPLFFSALQVNNQWLTPTTDSSTLTEALPFASKIKLNHRQNTLLIRFGNTDYINSYNRQGFEYKLEGLDKEWIYTLNPEARYTNLNPGHYTLLVRRADHQGEKAASLDIYIAAPWYNTWYSWLLYIIVIGGCIRYYLHNKKAKLQLAASLERERFEKQQTERVNQEKLVFFTNVSHEFRTPLTLIISHIDTLLRQTNIPPAVYNSILKVKRNANQMMNLISELLDFRKMTQSKFILELSQNDFSHFLKEIYLSFQDYALQRHINYHFESHPAVIICWFDAIQLEKVFSNLLSNAFKYTPSGGNITIGISLHNKTLQIDVKDSGNGISQEDQSRIFDRFYQAEDGKAPSPAPGTGIGLALTKSIVEKHHGSIEVNSIIGKGSCFTVMIPIDEAVYKNDNQIHFTDKQRDTAITETPVNNAEMLPDVPAITPEDNTLLKTPDNKLAGSQRKLLLVEDNEELLQILKDLFKPFYAIYCATNGKEGLAATFEYKPDLIISDIMMPEMSGTEMCLKIKSNIDLCHIPVILLTALNGTANNIEGFNRGADDYISKPFNSQLLLARANNLVRNRLLIQQQLHKKPLSEIDLTSINPLDQEFLRKVSTIIDKHIADSEFDIPTLCEEIGMGRSLLFNKFKALIGMTPNNYLLNCRLKAAAVMLKQYPDLPVSDVSVRCGFNIPVYFSRCFKNQYGCSPQHYRKTT